jgi:hypothetical protein
MTKTKRQISLDPPVVRLSHCGELVAVTLSRDRLPKLGLSCPICIGVAAAFVGRSYEGLLAEGVQGIVTCNTTSHPSNSIEIGGLLCVAALNAVGAKKAIPVSSG